MAAFDTLTVDTLIIRGKAAGDDVTITGLADIQDAVNGTTDWVTPSLGAGWVNLGSGYASARYRLLNGVVYVEGVVKNNSGDISTATVFTLPAGYRPTNGHLQFFGAGGVITVASTGAISPASAIADQGIFEIQLSFCVA